MVFYQSKNNQGQGLIEVIISIALLIGAVLGALTLASLTIRAGTQSRERIQAALLAQEGIEIVKNNRDSNWIKRDLGGENVSWDHDLLRENSFSGVGSLNESCASDPNDPNDPFKKFQRSTVIETDNSEKKKVTCTVTWTDASGTHSVKAIGYITNWQKE